MLWLFCWPPARITDFHLLNLLANTLKIIQLWMWRSPGWHGLTLPKEGNEGKSRQLTKSGFLLLKTNYQNLTCGIVDKLNRNSHSAWNTTGNR